MSLSAYSPGLGFSQPNVTKIFRGSWLITFQPFVTCYTDLLVFQPPRVEQELLELRRVRRAEVRQADRLLDVAHDLVPN